MGKDLMELALEIVEKAKTSDSKNSDTLDIEHNIAISEMVKHKNEKLVAILQDVCGNGSVTFDQLRDNGFPEKIVVALDAITPHDDDSYESYINRLKVDKLALAVKNADLTFRSDLSRIDNPTGRDFKRSKGFATMKRDLTLGKKSRVLNSPFEGDIRTAVTGGLKTTNKNKN